MRTFFWVMAALAVWNIAGCMIEQLPYIAPCTANCM